MLPLVSLGPICSTCVLSQIHLYFACAQFIPNRSSRLTTFPRILNCWSHKTTQNVARGIVGRIVFSLCPFPDESIDVHQIWCQSVQPFDSFPILLNLWSPNPAPPPPAMPPLGYWGATCIYIPRWIHRREPKLVPIGPAVWQLLVIFECLTP